jgi:hypothetical protein
MFNFIVFTISFIILCKGCVRKQQLELSDSVNTKNNLTHVWNVSEIKTDSFPCASKRVRPSAYRLVQMDTSAFFIQLRQSDGLTDTIPVDLVQSDGTVVKVLLARSASIPLEFESKYGIIALSGRLYDSNDAMVRLELDANGLRYMITSSLSTSIFVKLCDNLYLLYDKNTLPEGSKSDFE